MNELPKQAADLLTDARSRHSASAQELERGLSRLHAQLEFSDAGADFGGDDVATQAQPWSSTQGLFASKFVKLTLSALAISGGLGLTYFAYPPSAPSDSTVARSSAHEPALTESTTGEAAPTPLTSLERVQEPAKVAVQPPALEVSPRRERQTTVQGSARLTTPRTLRAQHEGPQAVRGTASTTTAAAAALRQTVEAPTNALAADVLTADAAATERQRGEASAHVEENAGAGRQEKSALAELDLVDQALKQLRAQDAAAALALLDEHARRYPTGKLSVERRGLRVVALCAAGRLSAGRAEQAAFLAREGGAPIAERVRRACKEER